MRKLLTLLNPSPFKIGVLVIILSCAVFYNFGDRKPLLLTSLDNRIIDTMFQWRGVKPTTGAIVIVDIDEKSLKHIGQWPWPRDIVARLVSAIHQAGAKVIGFDIVFAEEDRTSPHRLIASLSDSLQDKIPQNAINGLKESAALDYDALLGSAVMNATVVLGYVFQTTNDGLKNAADQPFPSSTIKIDPAQIPYDQLALYSAYRATVNVPAVAQAETEGFFNVFPDPSGTVRKVPLFMEMDGIPYPALSLEMLRLGLGEKEITINVSGQKKGSKLGLLGVTLAKRFIRTDDHGQVTVNYRGGRKTFPYLSSYEILQGNDLASLADKYVLIGTSAEGLLDLRATPFTSVFPGVEVHANLIDNVLANDPFIHDIFTEIGLTYALIIGGGLVLTALLAYSGPIIGGISSLLFIIFTILGNYHLFFLNNKIVGVVYPLVTIVTLCLIVTVFNYFFEGREKKYIRNAFSHYVSPDVVSQLMKNPDRLTLAGEQKEVTIFFNDIRGFTSISEKMNSAELGVFMNEYLTAMSNIVMAHKGMVDKYIGDAIMAIWGAPLDDDDHAANAVRASLHMIAELKKLRPAWEARGLPYIDIGVGLNTGMVSVGNFGSAERFDYTVLGDNVNLASRLEGSNKAYGTNIIISEYTHAAINDRFYCRFIDLVRVKGKKEPVRLYEPLLEGVPDAALKAEVDRFAEALDRYRCRDFDGAMAILIELNSQKTVPLYSLYLERVEAFKTFPPPPGWDGVFTFTTK